MSDPKIIATIPKNSREWVRVSLEQFRGVDLIDLRTLVEHDGDYVPTRKGVCLKIEKLPDLIAAINEVLAEAQRRGLIEREVSAAA